MSGKLKGKTIFLDTAPLIYYIENNKEFSGYLNALFDMNDKGVFRFVTSVITLTETLIHPIQKKELALAKKYEEILRNSFHLDLIEINASIASKAARIRAQYGFKTPDAIQLAVAQSEKAHYFLTNDYRLKKFTKAKMITPTDVDGII